MAYAGLVLSLNVIVPILRLDSSQFKPAGIQYPKCMQLTLIRHAMAETPNPQIPDANRALTPLGLQQSQNLKLSFLRLNWQFDEMLVSPLRRAQETAQVFLCPKETTELLAKTPGELLLQHLQKISQQKQSSGQQHCALVGHEPFLSQLVSLLMFGNTEQAEKFVFKKAGFYSLDCEASENKITATKIIAAFGPKLFSGLLDKKTESE